MDAERTSDHLRRLNIVKGNSGSRVSLVVVTALILGFALLGFGMGWILTQQPSSDGPPANVTEKEGDSPVEPAEEEISVPDEDVRGEEIPGLPRYPGSTRVAYEQKRIGDLLVTRTEYVARADLDQAREFYRDTFRAEEWAVADVSYSRGEWTFFVARGEREAVVEIEEQNSLIEVELESSKPRKAEKKAQDTDKKPKPPAEPAPQQGQDNAPAPQPEPEPQPEPAPQPAPVQGDDADDYGDDDADDEFEGGDD
jgi:cell division septation protein DedD